MIVFQRIRSFTGVDSKIADYLSRVEANFADAVQKLGLASRPVWTPVEVVAASHLARPWQQVLCNSGCDVNLPSATSELIGVEIQVVARGTSGVVVRALSGLVSGAASYSCTSDRATVFCCTKGGWFANA